MKKGFTLIELIITIAILLLLMGIGIGILGKTNIVIRNFNKKSAICEISDLLSFSKYYCKKNNTQGQIYLKKSGKYVLQDVNNGMKVCKEGTLPEGVYFYQQYIIPCNNSGELGSTTIAIYDETGKVNKITISVGVDNINYYEVDNE